MQNKPTAIRKRTQIANTNRLMFIWVAGISAIFGFALVASLFLVQMLGFNERVLQEKAKTVSTLKTNNNNIKDLESQIRALDANQSLSDIKANPDNKAVQVVLDALPSEANSLALGASIQKVLLDNIKGLELDSLEVSSADGSNASDLSVSTDEGDTASDNKIAFSFSVIGDETALTQALINLEKSIRTIDIVSLTVTGDEKDQLTMMVQARAYYEPAKVVELKDKTVK